MNSSAERRTLPETTHTPIRLPISAMSTVVNFCPPRPSNIFLIFLWSFIKGSGPDAVPPNVAIGEPYGLISE